MKRAITGFHQDQLQHWVAELSCGHTQHMRHNPPWTERPWVLLPQGRVDQIGKEIDCSLCDETESQR